MSKLLLGTEYECSFVIAGHTPAWISMNLGPGVVRSRAGWVVILTSRLSLPLPWVTWPSHVTSHRMRIDSTGEPTESGGDGVLEDGCAIGAPSWQSDT